MVYRDGRGGIGQAGMNAPTAVELAASILRTHQAVIATGDSVRRYAEEADSEIRRLWADNAELRDEILALSNRIETLTRARLTEPAEVAETLQRGFLRLQRDVGDDVL
jgi:hypothetical protein